MLSPVSIKLGTSASAIQLDAYLTELTWHVLVRGCLNCLLVMQHLILRLRYFR